MSCFYKKKRFPIKSKQFRFIVSSVCNDLKEPMKGCSNLHKVINPQQTLYLDGIQFISYKCTNKHIRRCFIAKGTYPSSLMHTSPNFLTLMTAVSFVKKKKERERESVIHLFHKCPFCITFQKYLGHFLFIKTTVRYQFDEKIIIFLLLSH